ncbi:UNVERIFIED_ORG: phosphoglycerol transferase MdoB-like AlkP superfamily enzyme [Agrobacterium larrymoorei]|nr:phosphoglycerol transferase MdoB-like AlkP superfamily enzyme [Agrobacterium larrymoorei]
MALDAFVTWMLLSQVGVPVLLGKTLSFLSTAAFAVLYLRRRGAIASTRRFIVASITLIPLLVSYGIFTLLLLRNPMLQWPLALIAAFVAALLLSLIGYWRAPRSSLER